MNVDYHPTHLVQFAKFCTCTEQNCRCGEKNVHEWAWDEEYGSLTNELSEHNLEVKFHPLFSTGTSIVRGNMPMGKGRHHIWEIKMVTPVYGTDVMVGVGTSKMDLTGTTETFCSLLGRDRESWGLSYRGYLQHAGEKRVYAARFGQGSLVGIHLDTWRGTLQFFINRKPYGVAFTGLRDVTLYPMASSTAAKSKMRITYCCSVPASLQMDCLSMLRPSQKAFFSATFPGLRHIFDSVFAQILQKEFDGEDDEFDIPTQFQILDDFDFALVGLARRKKQKISLNAERTLALCE